MRPKKGSYDSDFVKDFLMDHGGNGKNNTPTEVLMLPAGNLQGPSKVSPESILL